MAAELAVFMDHLGMQPVDLLRGAAQLQTLGKLFADLITEQRVYTGPLRGLAEQGIGGVRQRATGKQAVVKPLVHPGVHKKVTFGQRFGFVAFGNESQQLFFMAVDLFHPVCSVVEVF